MHLKELQIDDERKLVYAWFPAMFTRVDLALIIDKSSEESTELIRDIQKIIDKTERTGNRFDEESEIAFLNNAAFNQPVEVSEKLFKIIESCQDYHKLTFGLFDITINSVNGYKHGMSNIILDKVKQSVQFLHADILIDLSGFLKGFVLLEIRSYLLKKGIENALINLGNSSILAMGNHPYGNGWKVSIAESTDNQEIVLLNQCLTSSGNKRITDWPVIHPKTGTMHESSENISVITNDPALGEVLSTALFLANDEEKIQILSGQDAQIINHI